MIRKAASSWLGGFALLFALGSIAAPEVHATSMKQATIEDLTDAADLIVRGVVTDIWADADENGTIWTHAQVEVAQQFKGDAVEGVIVSQRGGVYHNDYSLIAGAARFSPGEEAVFFLERLGNGHTVPSGMFQGKYTVRIDPDSGREMLVRFIVPQDRVYDHRFIPHPAADQRFYMEDMEKRVFERLESNTAPVQGDK